MITLDLRRSTAYLYQGKWSRFVHWCQGSNISPCKATSTYSKVFLVSVEGAEAIDQPLIVSSHWLAGTDLAANKIITRMIISFEKNMSVEKGEATLIEPICCS